MQNQPGRHEKAVLMASNRSREGYQKQREHIARILKASEGMSSVRNTD
jgi:hypothetical protein